MAISHVNGFWVYERLPKHYTRVSKSEPGVASTPIAASIAKYAHPFCYPSLQLSLAAVGYTKFRCPDPGYPAWPIQSNTVFAICSTVHPSKTLEVLGS
jgi:hypothetical protein